MNAQPQRIGWGVLPRFIVVGMLSTAYTLIALRKSELHEGGNHIIAVLVGGQFLGLMIVAALWLYGRLQSSRSAVLLVALMAVANCSFLFQKYVPQSLQQDKELPLLGLTRLDHFVFFFPTCLIAFVGFALVLFHWRSASRTVPIALLFAAVGTLTFVYIVKQQRGAWFTPITGEGLGFLWQMTLTFFLGLSLWAGEKSMIAATSRLEVSVIDTGRSTRNGLITLGILFAFLITVQLWTSVVIYQARKRESEHQAQVRAVLAHAPSRQNLPPLEQEPVEKVLLARIAGTEAYSPKATILPEEKVLPPDDQATGRALYPERYSYTAAYADSNGTYIPVKVTAYPAADWAEYNVKPLPILYPDKVWKLAKFGNNVYQFGSSFYWSSGNKVVLLDCRLARQFAIDEFLKRYLEKYPSSL